MSTLKSITRCLILLLLLCILTACHTEHTWLDANCLEPRTCSVCGETEGEPLGHNWQKATCTDPATCTVCGATEGNPLGHEWSEVTCTEDAKCARCGATGEKAPGHNWKDATCTEPQKCIVCGEIGSDPLGHTLSDWTVTSEPTCSKAGQQYSICSVCGQKITEQIPKTDHTPGEWVVEVEATLTTAGERVQYCTVCGEEAARERYELTADERKELFKQACQTCSYSELARRPSDYIAKRIKVRGQVVQVIESGDNLILRVNITPGRYYWDDTVYVECDKPSSDEPRILEDDIITIYGLGAGTITYKTVLGASVTVPAILGIYIEFD